MQYKTKPKVIINYASIILGYNIIKKIKQNKTKPDDIF